MPRPITPTTYHQRPSTAIEQEEEDPSRIQDSGQRKKVQNRIAQRTYRQRIKKRIEALEMVQQGQITNNPSMPQPLRDTTSPKLNNSHVMNRQYPLSAASSTNPTPSLVSAFTRDESYPSPFEGHHNPYSAISTSSTDTFPTFKPPDGPSSHGVWNLSQAINAGLDLQDLARPGDVEYDDMPEWSCPELEKEATQESSSSSPRCQGSRTALHIAAEKGKTSTVQFLLSLQPDIDILAQDDEGRTALHIAVTNKQQGVIAELVRNPNCLEVKDRGGQTALHAAAAQGHERAVACLVAAGADLECKDANGRTAFHLAAADGRDNTLQLLYKEGANINAKTKF